MRVLEIYNKQREKKLGHMVGACMKSLWLCYAVLNVCWLVQLFLDGDGSAELLAQCFGPMALTGALCLVYQLVVVNKGRELHHAVAYLILNVYVILLLLHPSGLHILDGLVFGVIVTYPVWTDQRWVKIQTIVFAVMIVLRHVLLRLYAGGASNQVRLTEALGLFCIGAMLFYNTRYVHNQTMLLGDATRMDAATGLYNHEYFYEELETRMHVFDQTPEKQREDACFCVLIADIDNFKRVNDTYGHVFGDEVLLGLADIFKNYCGGKDFAARYGGEEFAMIVGGCHKKDALTRANTIRKRFAETVFVDDSGAEHHFTVSFGVAEYDKSWDIASKFFDQADQALYQAKNTGKNRVCSL